MLLPRFQQLMSALKASQQPGAALLLPEEQVEVVDVGDQLLRIFRAERSESAALLGNAPPPAGVDEAQLEVTLHRLRELRRTGWLAVDRSTSSWEEWRRRQRLRGDYAESEAVEPP